MRFSITWREGAYYVSVPEYGGGEVVTADEHDDLRAVGDHLQSEASRLAEWAEQWSDDVPMPYEVRMALIGVAHAVADWTKLRCAEASASTASQRCPDA